MSRAQGILLTALLCGCAQTQAGSCVDKLAGTFSFVALDVPQGSLRPANAGAFSFIDATVSLQELIEKVGPADGVLGSGVSIYVWCVPDGEVRVWTADGTTIGFVRRNDQLIFDRRKKKS